MNEAPGGPATFSAADRKFAVRLLDRGRSFPEVEDSLLGRGLSPGQAAALLADLAT